MTPTTPQAPPQRAPPLSFSVASPSRVRPFAAPEARQDETNPFSPSSRCLRAAVVQSQFVEIRSDSWTSRDRFRTPGPIGGLFFVRILLYAIPNPRHIHHFRALRAVNAAHASLIRVHSRCQYRTNPIPARCSLCSLWRSELRNEPTFVSFFV